MKKTKLSGDLVGKMAFEMTLDGHPLVVDAGPELGGENKGPRPKQLLLAGLIGCTGIDVMSILNKMRVNLDAFNISVEASSVDQHPQVYDSIKLTYSFKGDKLPIDKLEKAVNLSKDRYCPVYSMLSKAANIETEIKVEE